MDHLNKSDPHFGYFIKVHILCFGEKEKTMLALINKSAFT